MTVPWTYRVSAVHRVVDGDTVDLVLDLGFHLSATLRFRLLGVNTPERGQPGWQEATTYVHNWLLSRQASGLTARTARADGFGRWLADVQDAEGRSLSQALLDAGHAGPYVR